MNYGEWSKSIELGRTLTPNRFSMGRMRLMQQMGLMGPMGEMLNRRSCRERFGGPGSLFRPHQAGVPFDGVWHSIPGKTLRPSANETEMLKLATLAHIKPAEKPIKQRTWPTSSNFTNFIRRAWERVLTVRLPELLWNPALVRGRVLLVTVESKTNRCQHRTV